jgi:hypothetical protein
VFHSYPFVVVLTNGFVQVFDLLVGWPLFGDPGPYAPDDVTEEDYDLQQMTQLAGERLSLKFLSKCERRDEFFDRDGIYNFH